MSSDMRGPLNPIDSDMVTRLDRQYVNFYNKHMAHTAMIQQMDWHPGLRSAPAVPGGAEMLAVHKTEEYVAFDVSVELESFSIRLFYPRSTGLLPVFIWYHGGGMVLGSLDAENAFCSRVAKSAQCAVVAVNYRLAPEYTYPTGSDDGWTAFEYIYRQGAKLGLDPTRLGIGGSSSGANIAAMVSQKAGMSGMAIAFVVLGVPVCDNTATEETYKSWKENRHCPGLPAEKMLWFRKQYFPNDSDRSNPKASPLLAPDEWFINSSNKVYIALAELDLLRSEGEAYSARLQAVGKEVVLNIYPGVPHATQAMDAVLDSARTWIKDMCTYIAVQFGRHPADINMMDLYPKGAEVEVPQLDGGPVWYRLHQPMVLGEAPIYHPADNTLHYVDCLAQPPNLQILKLGESGEAVGQPRVIELEDSVTVACFRKTKPGYICAYYQGIAFMDENGRLQVLREIIPRTERHIRRFNDGGIDCAGRFWLAEIDCKALAYGMGRVPESYGTPLGRLWRFDPDGSLRIMENGLICGNGIAWSPDNKKMYLNDSAAGFVWVYDFDAESGDIKNKRLFIDRRHHGGEPDGMVCDMNGNLWIAMFASFRVMCFDALGKHVKDICFPSRNMTCVTWGGPQYDTLYITSGQDRSREARGTDDGGHLFKYSVGVAGVPKYEFNG